MKRNPSCSQFLTREKENRVKGTSTDNFFDTAEFFPYDKVHTALRTKATQSAQTSLFFRSITLKLLLRSQQTTLSVSKCWIKLDKIKKKQILW